MLFEARGLVGLKFAELRLNQPATSPEILLLSLAFLALTEIICECHYARGEVLGGGVDSSSHVCMALLNTCYLCSSLAFKYSLLQTRSIAVLLWMLPPTAKETRTNCCRVYSRDSLVTAVSFQKKKTVHGLEHGLSCTSLCLTPQPIALLFLPRKHCAPVSPQHGNYVR